ncbi:MAG: ParB N-terminal domain-containing protein [Pseudotabrizicola sp.]|uniref:ParB N-terminal domain-containing protein n=1 Tax=Pseudotabrizicola sp. TaxID=2939647 RepID=UPI0027219DC9|nr:ParB N-terminal domain-containing protein [Pseudotabrizicola sp.]MDO9639654.1 ParB N-terminal domain-containing protein [Pseudotabrizicola sp.]
MKNLPSPILTRVTLSEIRASNRLRPVSQAGVEAILASVAEIGQIKDPMHVRAKKDGLILLAGGHRMAAYISLGIEEADVWLWSGITDDVARLIEIDDNLAGAEMNALDTAVFLAERKKVYERLHPETAAAAFKGNQHTGSVAADTMSVTSFARATAEKFGMSDRHVRRLIEAGTKLGVDSARLRQAPRPVSLKDLIEIAKISEVTERYAVIDALINGQVKSAGEARRVWTAKEAGHQVPIKDPVEDGFQALMKAWERAPMAAKKRFLLEHEKDIWEAQNKGAPLANWSEAAE